MKNVLVWLLLVTSFHAVGQQKEMLVGVENINYYPLFDFSGSENHNPSFARDLLTSFFNQHNIPFKFVPLPIKRFDKWYVEENIDFKFPDNFRWRQDFTNKLNITFSEPIVKLMAGTYVVKADREITRNKVKTLGTMLGFFPTLWLSDIKNNKVKLMEDASTYSVVKHLLHGNSDAINIDPNVIRINLKKLNRENDVVLAENIYHQEYHYHFSSIKYPEVILLFNQFLKDNQPLVASLKEKYHIVE